MIDKARFDVKELIYLEAQCVDKEHASFNAATINSDVAVEENIFVYAAESHLTELSNRLKIASTRTSIPSLPNSIPSRIRHFFRCFFTIIKHKSPSNRLVVLSMPAVQLFLAPLYSLVFKDVTIYHHGLSENIFANNFIKRAVFRSIFKYLGSISNINNVFLGGHVEQSFTKEKLMRKNFSFIRLPFEPKVINSVKGGANKTFKVITFGQQTFEKGFKDNLWMWSHLNKKGIDCQIVGFANESVLNYLESIHGNLHLSRNMCTEAYLNEQIESADLVFFMYPQNLYRVTSSGAYFDAIAFDKKIIAYVDNPFFYHEQTINPSLILCTNKHQMKKIVLKERDRKLQENKSA